MGNRQVPYRRAGIQRGWKGTLRSLLAPTDGRGEKRCVQKI